MRYVALLRGIGPMNPNMRNENLRGVAESLGYGNVTTVISTGNVVFDADESQRGDEIEARLEAAWLERLGFTSTTIVRSRDDVARLLDANPFGDVEDTKASSLQATFFKREPNVDIALPYASPAGDYRIVSIADRVAFSVVDLTGTPDLMRFLEKTFGKEISTRTWKTVHRIWRKLA
jgi:uncharacterized protein (DUF1697 family)